jgi:hypothetical protein
VKSLNLSDSLEERRAQLEQDAGTHRMNVWTQVAGYAALLLFGCVVLSFGCDVAQGIHDADTARMEVR